MSSITLAWTLSGMMLLIPVLIYLRLNAEQTAPLEEVSDDTIPETN